MFFLEMEIFIACVYPFPPKALVKVVNNGLEKSYDLGKLTIQIEVNSGALYF